MLKQQFRYSSDGDLFDALHDLLLGERFDRNLDSLSAAVLFLGTFIAYATGLFYRRGGVIFLPADATLVSVVLATYFPCSVK